MINNMELFEHQEEGIKFLKDVNPSGEQSLTRKKNNDKMGLCHV
jgi:hypothetical protein